MTSDLKPVYSKFTSRAYSFVPDSNNGSYSSAVLQFDCSALAGNSDTWYDWQNAIEVPFVITAQYKDSNGTYVGGGTTMQHAAFLCGMKNGYWNLVNSYSLSINGRTVQTQVPLNNMYVSYKVTSKLSSNEVSKFGKTLGFSKDSSYSNANVYNTAASSAGLGVCNNLDYSGTTIGVNGSAQSAYGYNTGLYTRQLWSSITPNTTICSAQQFANIARNYYTYSNDTSGNSTGQWYILATIRLKGISDAKLLLTL